MGRTADEMTTPHEQLDPSAVFALREMLPEDLDAGEDKLYKATDPVAVVSRREDGVFDRYIVASGDHSYEVIRLGWFVSCECKDFQFSGGACKHAVLCMPQVCRKCQKRDVPRRGAVCDRCEMKAAPYLPPTSTRVPERLGNVRF